MFALPGPAAARVRNFGLNLTDRSALVKNLLIAPRDRLNPDLRESTPMLRKLAVSLALACAVTAAHANEEAIRKAVGDARRRGQGRGRAKTGILGLYEVRAHDRGGPRIIYTDEAASYFFLGNIIDNKTQTDLTEARMSKLNAIRFADLPLAQAFKIVRGKGTRQLAYFSDPRCPYCRRFDQELTKVDDVTVHVFLIPIISPESAAVSKAVWCAPDRAKAWLDLMLNDVAPPAPKANCDAPLEKNLAFSRKHRINGTPTLIFADGQTRRRHDSRGRAVEDARRSEPEVTARRSSLAAPASPSAAAPTSRPAGASGRRAHRPLGPSPRRNRRAPRRGSRRPCPARSSGARAARSIRTRR